MNHYPHHIGDFNNGTRHLTRIERSIYRDLIELYYDTETPLTSDIDALARRIIARSDEERQALLCVLGEFFSLEDGLYFHARCDEEIASYQSRVESARTNGQRGGRPSKPRKTESVISANPDITGSKANQNQNQNQNQEPEGEGEPSRASGFPTLEEAMAFTKGQLLPTDQVENWHSNREAQGWVRGNGIAITNWQADLRTWINREARGEFKPSPKSKTNGNHDHRTDKRAREFAESILVPDLN
jgi:uncharacterized protein YdaU (DUF1376 family)